MLTYSFLVWLELREREHVQSTGSPTRRLFPPRRDRRRQSLAAIHRQVVNRLLESCIT